MSLSYSGIDAYRKCPKQYEYAFVRKLPQPMTKENAFGVSVHSALSKWGKWELELGIRDQDFGRHTLFGEEKIDDRGDSLSLGALLKLWSESFVVNGYETTFEADYDRERGAELMRMFYEWWGREKRKVVAVEKGFKLLLGTGNREQGTGNREQELGNREQVRKHHSNSQFPIPNSQITGRFDRIEQLPDNTLRIIDFKTGPTRTQEQTDQDLQMSVYALAAQDMEGKNVAEIILLFLNEDGLTERRTQRTAGELLIASKSIALIHERIDQRDFAPTPSVAVCSRCSFRRVCPASAVKK